MNASEWSPRPSSQSGGRRPPSSASTAPIISPTSHRSTSRYHNQKHHQQNEAADSEVAATTIEEITNLGQRSQSLNTLQPTIIQPRMAQLETLEAKMASIEVSLSSSPRRKKNGSLTGISLGPSIRSIPKELAVKELENLRNALRDKENIIQSLKGQLTVPGIRLTSSIRNNNNNNNNNNNSGNVRELTEVEKKQAEDRLNRLKIDVDNKRLAIKNLKMALERLDITDNIDVRIQQAELEYQLGREELNLLTLLEETRALQLCIEESNKIAAAESYTLYSCIDGNECVILQALEVDFDPKSPKFGAGQRDSMSGLYVDWALEESKLKKDDRLIEVNGKIVLNKTQDDLARLLAAAPDPALIVILRKINQNDQNPNINNKSNSSATNELSTLRTELETMKEIAEEAQKSKEGLKSDNIRLTHRISYLEEQVSELLSRKAPDADIRILTPTPVISKSNQNVTQINITSQSPASTPTPSAAEYQIFQKGNQKTALVHHNGLDQKTESATAGYPDRRSKSSLSNVSNTHIPSPLQNGDYQKNRHRHRSSRSGVQSPVGNQQMVNDKITYRKHNHHHHHREKDYSSETNSAVEVKRYNKRNHENHRYSADFSKANSEREYVNDIMDQSYKKATKIVHELTRNNNLYEKHRQKCITASEKYNADLLKHYNGRKSTSVIDFRSEVHIGPKYMDSKSVEDLDANPDSPRTTTEQFVYKKIQDSRSVKSLDFDSDCNSTPSINNNNGSCRLNGHMSDTNYASEASNDGRKMAVGYYHQNVLENGNKPRPTPPKKPIRLSLHKTHSLQSIEAENQQSKIDRKSMKRNHKGEMPILNGKGYGHQNGDVNGRSYGQQNGDINGRSYGQNGDINGRAYGQNGDMNGRSYAQNGDMNGYRDQVNWNYRRKMESSIDNGSWC